MTYLILSLTLLIASCSPRINLGLTQVTGGNVVNPNIATAEDLVAVSPIGEGTEEAPFRLATVGHWEKLQELDEVDMHFKLVSDLDFEGAVIDQYPPLKGQIEGNNYTFTNVATSAFCGLFSKIDGAKVSNLTIKNITVNNSATMSYCGALADSIENGSEIKNIRIENIVFNTPNVKYAGSLAGSFKNSSAEDISINNVSMISWDYSGIIAGWVQEGIFKRIYIDSNTSLTQNRDRYHGGIFGVIYDGTEVSEVEFNGTINSTNATTGWVASFATGAGSRLNTKPNIISNIYFGGRVSFSSGAGRTSLLIAELCGTATNAACLNNSQTHINNVIYTAETSGGQVSASGIILGYSYNTGVITADEVVYLDSSISSFGGKNSLCGPIAPIANCSGTNIQNVDETLLNTLTTYLTWDSNVWDITSGVTPKLKNLSHLK